MHFPKCHIFLDAATGFSCTCPDFIRSPKEASFRAKPRNLGTDRTGRITTARRFLDSLRSLGMTRFRCCVVGTPQLFTLRFSLFTIVFLAGHRGAAPYISIVAIATQSLSIVHCPLSIFMMAVCRRSRAIITAGTADGFLAKKPPVSTPYGANTGGLVILRFLPHRAGRTAT